MNFKEKNKDQFIGLTEYRTTDDDSIERNKNWWSDFTVEPMWLGTISSLTMGFVAFQNLFLERACTVDLDHSIDLCFHSNGTVKREIEMESQKIVTSLSIGSNFIEYLFTFLMVLFLGSWSDSKGRRKPIILIPILGMLITSVCLLILQFFPKISTGWIICMKVLPYSIGGSISLMTMATFNYLDDICRKTGRSITVVKRSNSIVISISTAIGFLFTPVLLNIFNFTGVLVTLIVFEIASFLYCFYKIKDVTEKKAQTFDLTLPLEALKCVFKKRNGNKRKNVLLMVLVPCTTSITLLIEIVPLYLYLRHKFQWTELEYGLFSAYREIIQFTSSIIILKILTKLINLQSRTVGIIGSISQFLSTSALILSTESWMIFTAPIFGIVSRAVFIAEKSILNKQIISSEEDKFNFIATILDAITAMWAIPLANYIYFISIAWMPNLFLFLSLMAAGAQFLLYYYASSEP